MLRQVMPVRDKQRAQVSLQLQLHPQQMLSGAETNWCGREHYARAIVDQLPMPLRGAGLRTRLVWHGWRGSISRQQLRQAVARASRMWAAVLSARVWMRNAHAGNLTATRCLALSRNLFLRSRFCFAGSLALSRNLLLRNQFCFAVRLALSHNLFLRSCLYF